MFWLVNVGTYVFLSIASVVLAAGRTWVWILPAATWAILAVRQHQRLYAHRRDTLKQT